mgnify:FL=1
MISWSLGSKVEDKHKFNLKSNLMVTACMLATEMAATSASCYHTVQTSAASPSLKRPFSGSNSI